MGEHQFECQRIRDAVFGDIYHIPEWRLCAVQDCPEILHRPAFFCQRHRGMAFESLQSVT